MKKRTLIVVLAILCIATSCFVGSTFAKYVGSATGSDTAKVATWTFTQDSTDFTDTINFDLFESSRIVDTVDGNADTEVAADRVAPGTKGTFSTEIKNTSEVDAQYKLTFTATTSPTNLVYTFTIVNDNATPSDTSDDTAVVTDGALPSTFNQIEMGETVTVTANWVWAFETTGGDAADTNNAGSDIAVSMSIALEQID